MVRRKKILFVMILVTIAIAAWFLIFFLSDQSSKSPFIGSSDNSSLSSSSSYSDVEREIQYNNHKIEYRYYDSAKNSYQTESVTVSGENDLQKGLELVAENIFHKPLSETPLNPNKITLNDGDLRIDFKKDIVLAGLGASEELAILDALFDIYTNNIDGVNAIYYSIDGGDFITGHTVQYANQAYQSAQQK